MRRAAAEAIGTAILLAAIVGSGIMASELSGSNAGLTLFINSIATGATLAALIAALGPLSGAHFNPAVTLAFAMRKVIAWRDVPAYVLAQCSGAVVGVVIANAMFREPTIYSTHARYGANLWLSECLATFGLIAVIVCCVRYQSTLTAVAVGAYIAAAYWFTSSTSFANPAVTLARSLSDTFAGIAPSGIAPFILAQLMGASLAVAAFAWILPVAPVGPAPAPQLVGEQS